MCKLLLFGGRERQRSSAGIAKLGVQKLQQLFFSEAFVSNAAPMGKLKVLAVLPLFVGLAWAQSPVDQVIAEAQKASALESNLQKLTDQIGGRVSGTPELEKAAAWGVDALKAAGADSVHTESFSLPVSWSEGATEVSISAPESFKLRGVSVALAPALAPHKGVP